MVGAKFLTVRVEFTDERRERVRMIVVAIKLETSVCPHVWFKTNTDDYM